MSGDANFQPRRELARRVSGGIEITLYWSAADNRTSIEVWQPDSGETLAFAVPPERALDAFYHPFAHLALASAEPIATVGRMTGAPPPDRPVRGAPDRRRPPPVDRLLPGRRRPRARVRVARARRRVPLDRSARPLDARTLGRRGRSTGRLASPRLPDVPRKRARRVRAPAVGRGDSALLLRRRDRRAERDRLDAGSCGVLPRPRRPPPRVPGDARRRHRAPISGSSPGRSGREKRPRDGYPIGWHAGPRSPLRELFELADDSPDQIDSYIDLGTGAGCARRGREIVGHLQLVPGTQPDVARIKSLAVHPMFRRRGIGSRLVGRRAGGVSRRTVPDRDRDNRHGRRRQPPLLPAPRIPGVFDPARRFHPGDRIRNRA